MRKVDELREGCIAKAGEQEMCFTLLSRDAAAPSTIRHWVIERLRLGLNNAGDPQIVEALECSRRMEVEKGQYKPQPQSPTPCDGNHAAPEYADKQCWHKSPTHGTLAPNPPHQSSGPRLN